MIQHATLSVRLCVVIDPADMFENLIVFVRGLQVEQNAGCVKSSKLISSLRLSPVSVPSLLMTDARNSLFAPRPTARLSERYVGHGSRNLERTARGGALALVKKQRFHQNAEFQGHRKSACPTEILTVLSGEMEPCCMFRR